MPWQLRITEATLYAELGPGTGPLPVSFRTPCPLPAAAALPLQCRSASSAGSAASSREPVQLRCRGSWSEGSGCAAERVRDRPAWWPGRRRRPSGNARPAAARRLCVGWGAGAASMAGAARFRFASGLRAAACLLRPLCCRSPRAALRYREHLPDGKPLPVCAGLGRERRAGFAAMPHFAKGRSPCLEGAAERRRGMVRRWAARRPPGRRKAQGIPVAIGVAAVANFPHREAGGCRGGVHFPCVHGQE